MGVGVAVESGIGVEVLTGVGDTGWLFCDPGAIKFPRDCSNLQPGRKSKGDNISTKVKCGLNMFTIPHSLLENYSRLLRHLDVSEHRYKS